MCVKGELDKFQGFKGQLDPIDLFDAADTEGNQ
jgi:hypothetical protein